MLMSRKFSLFSLNDKSDFFAMSGNSFPMLYLKAFLSFAFVYILISRAGGNTKETLQEWLYEEDSKSEEIS